jgi:hypothetical protein
VISLPFCLPKAGLLFESGFLLVWWVVLPTLVPISNWVPLCIIGPHPDFLGGQVPSLEQAVCRCLVGITSPGGPGNVPCQQGRWKNHGLHNPGNEPPRNVMGNSNRDMGLWGKEAMLYCADTDSVDLCLKAEPQKQRVSPYVPLQAGYRGNKILKIRFNPHTVICSSIDYFTLVLVSFYP